MAAPSKATRARGVQAWQYDGTNGPAIISWITTFLAANVANVAQQIASTAEAGGTLTVTWTGGIPPVMAVHTGDYVVLDVLTFRAVDATSFGLMYP